ncbi:MAG: DUF190 domain-containing protein [Bacteroidota bacterium]|jgi:hypothetical protein
MKLSGQGKLLRIFIGEDDRYGGKQLFEAVLYLAKEKGLAGATVTRGIEGFGARHHIHKSSLVDLSSDLPIIIEIADTEENIEMILPMIDNMIEKAKCGAMMTVERIDVRKYTAGE